MIEVLEINDIEGLCEFRQPWHALLERTPAASFFHSLDWLACYWKHFAADSRLRILIATENRQPIGILPLVLRTEPTRVGRLRMLGYPLHDWATFFGPVGPNPTITLLAGLRHVRQTPRDWDVLDLRWIDVEGNDLGRTERALAQTGFRALKQKWDQTSVVDFSDTWQTYWQGRDAKFRKNADRLERRMLEGTTELVRYRPQPSDGGDVDPRWDLYDACLAVAERSWQGARGDRTNLCHSEVQHFFRDAHAAAARRGSLDMVLLYYNGEPAAFVYNYYWKGHVYGLRRGFDPRFGQLRPGTVLQKMMLKDGHQRGDRFYDLGAGSHETKFPWRTSVQTSYRLTCFPSLALRVQLLRWNRWLRRRLYGDADIACSQLA